MAFVAVGELDLGVVDGIGAFGEFFETDDGDAGGCGGPGVVLDELAADSV